MNKQLNRAQIKDLVAYNEAGVSLEKISATLNIAPETAERYIKMFGNTAEKTSAKEAKSYEAPASKGPQKRRKKAGKKAS